MYYKICVYIGISNKRMNDELLRLNQVYVEMLPIRHTIQKCLKQLCETEPYRMLKEWTYEMHSEPLPEDKSSPHPDYTDVSTVIYILPYIFHNYYNYNFLPDRLNDLTSGTWIAQPMMSFSICPKK